MNVTQLIGIHFYAIAGILCFSVKKANWLILALINFLICIECAVGVRHIIHDQMITVMGYNYAERAPLQKALATGVSILGFIVVVFSVYKIRSPQFGLAFIGTTLSIALFGIETISLHKIDRILYYEFGPIFLIALFWAVFAMLPSSAAASMLFRRANPFSLPYRR